MPYLIQSLNNVTGLALVEREQIYFFTNKPALTCYNLNDRVIKWSVSLNTQYLLLHDNHYLYPYKGLSYKKRLHCYFNSLYPKNCKH